MERETDLGDNEERIPALDAESGRGRDCGDGKAEVREH